MRFVVTVDGNVQDAEIGAPISSVTTALNVDVRGETNVKYSAFVFDTARASELVEYDKVCIVINLHLNCIKLIKHCRIQLQIG